MNRIRIRQYELAYRDEGAGDAVLLIHGLAGDHSAWEPQITAWKSHLRVIAVDTRGAGQSTQRDEPVTLESLADDFIALLEHLNIDRVHVVGRSMGGCIAQWMALKAPRRIASLALLASCGKFDPLALRCLENMREVLEWTGSWAAHAKHSVRNFVSAHFFNHEQERVQHIERLIGSSSRLQASYIQQNLAVGRHDLLDRLSHITCPVLVMSGSEDPLGGPLLTSWMLRRLPDARHTSFDGCSHFFMMEEPERFMNEMQRWFSDVVHGFPNSHAGHSPATV
jgi:3-oxoadipate enol-lactonase